MVHPVFPAHAGMSPYQTQRATREDGFPRTRGDEPESRTVIVTGAVFSPHTRG